MKFYLKSSGRSPVEDFLKDVSQDIRADFFDAVSALTSGSVLSMPLSRNLGSIHSGLHELRLKDRAGQVRFFYYIKKNEAIYVVHAFKKKTQDLPKKEIELVLQRIKEI